MKEYVYGHWRGKPAREIIGTGNREVFLTDDRYENGHWQYLGMGYCTEFQAFPDQLAAVDRGDEWGDKHREHYGR